MSLQKCEILVNRAKKELQPHGTLEFPCAAYEDLYTGFPWHWHEELEILYITGNPMTVKIPGRTFLLEPGDGIFLNTNILHFAAADPPCLLRSLVFAPSLITGSDTSAFAKKYLTPILSAFEGFFLKAGEQEDIFRAFEEAFRAMGGGAPGYEFAVRENLSRICLSLYHKLPPELSSGDCLQHPDHLRIRKMLDCIHGRFGEDLCLKDIAGAAQIGEREALRCFQRTIQLSPMQYLLKYRMMQGADLLASRPNDSISQIAAGCGFDSPSNFSKMFKRFYHCTPREYRKRCGK